MKKIFICLLSAVVLSNCEVSVQKTNAQDDNKYAGARGYYRYQYDEEVHDGMKYGIWWKVSETSQTGYAIFAVNLTKDSLEVELLRKQLEKINLVNSKK